MLLALTGAAFGAGWMDPVRTFGDGTRCQQHRRGAETRAVLALVGLPTRSSWAAVLCTDRHGTVLGWFTDRSGRVVCDVTGVYDHEAGCYLELHTTCADQYADRAGGCFTE